MKEGYVQALICGLALCCFLAGVPLYSTDQAKDVSRNDAANLVKKWLNNQGYRTHSPRFAFSDDPDQANFPTFYFFSANYAQDHSAPTLGHFAVNRNTADLWDVELCKKLSTSALRTAQRFLRNRIHLSERDYRKLSRLAPCSGPT